MKASTVLLIIEAIKLLQTRDLDEKAAKRVINKRIKGTAKEKLLVFNALKSLDLSWEGKLIKQLLDEIS